MHELTSDFGNPQIYHMIGLKGYQLDLAERKIISKFDFQGRVARTFLFIFTVVGFLSADGGGTGPGPLTRTYLAFTSMFATSLR